MNKSLNSFAPLARRATAFSLAFALLAGSFVALPAASAQQQQQSAASKTTARLSEEQRIVHVLGRLGFGARPGDVERVRKIGLERYVEAQLAPEKIAEDASLEAKLRNLSSYWMTTAELYQKYPQPGQLLRALERRGSLPADLAEARDNRKGGDDAATAATKKGAAEKMNAEGAMPNETASKSANGGEPEGSKNEARRDYRQAVQEYYREHNLLQPARITAELQASRILRAVYSERQLQEVLVDFWTNHFNVYANKGADRWLLVSYDRDTIRPHTLGKFKDLLLATAQSPAMLFYLDNFQSASPNARQGAGDRPRMRRLFETLTDPQMRGGGNGGQAGQQRRGDMNRRRQLMREQGNGQNAQMPAASQQQQAQAPAPGQPPRMRRGINENYARELMELHTLGVEGGYTQKDVQEVARCFTGWTIFAPRGGNPLAMPGDAASAPPLERAGTFYFNPRLHDDGEKLVLGHKIPAGGGINDGLAVLDILSKHPSTAKFIATKLARRFVMDNPTPALVERISAAYTKSDGDIRTTLSAIFASPEFNAPENYRAKIKTPFELAVSAVRSLGGETTGAPALHQWIARMGEPLYQYQAPTGYPDTAEHWVNTGALLERMNFALALVGNRINGTRVDLARFDGAGGTSADKSRLVEQFAAVILQGDMSERTKAALLKQLNEAATTTTTATTNTVATGASNPATRMTGEMNNDDAMLARGGGGGGGRRGGARREMAANAPISDVARIAALILGSPEFQRQ